MPSFVPASMNGDHEEEDLISNSSLELLYIGVKESF